jgi:hypothetical protein
MKAILLVTLCVLVSVAGINGALGAPLLSDTAKKVLFLSPWEGWVPTWNLKDYVSTFELAGYRVEMVSNENASISFLMTHLADYDIIIIRTESFYLEGLNYYCSGEPVTIKSPTTFASEISEKEIGVSQCIGFSVKFLQHHYPAGTLKQGLVYVVGGPAGDLSQAFLAGGSSVYVGYDDPYSLEWGRMDALSQALFRNLLQGSSVRDAISDLYVYLCRAHGESGNWPMLTWQGDGDFKI